MFNQAKAAAFAATYTEVMQKLEIVKINLQKKTPFFRILDEPQLPLFPVRENPVKHLAITEATGLSLMPGLLIAEQLYKS